MAYASLFTIYITACYILYSLKVTHTLASFRVRMLMQYTQCLALHACAGMELAKGLGPMGMRAHTWH